MNIDVKTALWMNSPSFKVLSFEARAVWFEMVKIMAVSKPYGYLRVGNSDLTAKALASIVGMHESKCAQVLDEIVDSGLCQRVTEDGRNSIICTTLIRDETIRRKRAAGGKKGGNPVLKRASEEAAEAAGAHV